MRVTKAYLERRTANLEQRMIDYGIHPDPDKYRLILDYVACYGGYQMVFQDKTNNHEHYFFLSSTRLTGSEMEDYQQGMFDIFAALYQSEPVRKAIYRGE